MKYPSPQLAITWRDIPLPGWAVQHIDRRGAIPGWALRLWPTLHWCAGWDDMLVDEGECACGQWPGIYAPDRRVVLDDSIIPF